MQRIARFVTPVVLLVVLLGACTGDEGDGRNGGGTGGATAGRTGATGDTSLEPVGETGASGEAATYSYVNAGLEVTMTIEDGTGTMQVDNGTDHDVGPPSFYILDATTGARSEGRVEGGSRLAPGQTASFDVSLEGTRIADVGLIILLLGKDNYGAFVRTA